MVLNINKRARVGGALAGSNENSKAKSPKSKTLMVAPASNVAASIDFQSVLEPL
jgi:hypothetical protein